MIVAVPQMQIKTFELQIKLSICVFAIVIPLVKWQYQEHFFSCILLKSACPYYFAKYIIQGVRINAIQLYCCFIPYVAISYLGYVGIPQSYFKYIIDYTFVELSQLITFHMIFQFFMTLHIAKNARLLILLAPNEEKVIPAVKNVFANHSDSKKCDVSAHIN